MNPSADMPPVLLTAPDFHGTLAAVRSLGRAGVPVTVADPDGMAPATWSRYASARVRCPDVRDTSRFLAWLLQFGQRSPRHVLLPTSDDTAWLYARHHAELTRYFYLQPADVQTVYSLLNKKRLNQKAGEAGLSVPRAWFPESRAELAQCAREARFPLLIKPATQIMFRPRGKGFRVEAPEALETLYQKAGACPYEPPLLEFDPDAARPMIQEFHAEAAEGIYNLSGLAHDGELVALRAGRKILQWPRRIGIGLCFAEAAVEPGLAAGLGRLLRPLRFGGVFEAEFIQVSGSFLLIDFNPRFYNQMAFDLARGLPVAMFAYCQALGRDEPREQLGREARANSGLNGSVYAHRSLLKLMLFGQRLSGRLGRDEIANWRRWYQEHEGRCVDPVYDPADVMPALLDSAWRLRHYVRHPRNFLSWVLLDR